VKSKILFLFLSIIFGFTGNSYELGVNNNLANKSAGRTRPQLLLGIGTSTFLGDLGGKPTLGTNDASDIDIPTISYAVSAGIRVPFGNSFSLRALISHSEVSGSDQYTTNRERRGRNLSFKSPLTEGSLTLEFMPGKGNMKSKHFYFYGGIGLAFFNPYTMLNGNKYYLQPLGTEGQNTDQNNPPYSLSATVYPFGLGYRMPFGIGQLSIELAMRKSTTDYIDDVSTFYADPAQIRAGAPEGQSQVAVDLADRNISDIPGFSDPGAIRGDPTDMDNYFYVMVYYHIPLGGGRNNGSFGSGRKTGRGTTFGSKRQCVIF
jgi:hypothetical protein